MKTGKSVSISMGTLWQFAFIIAKITVIVKMTVSLSLRIVLQIAPARLVDKKLFTNYLE